MVKETQIRQVEKRVGRKRDEDSRIAILDAAIDMVADSGYQGLSIEGIAQRSGTGKQTIYRWWKTKADVVFEALTVMIDFDVPVIDTGNFERDIHSLLSATFTLINTRHAAGLLKGLMAESQMNPEFAERFRDQFLAGRRQVLLTILDRASARNELPAGVSSATLVSVVFGTLWYRLLAADGELDDVLVDELTVLVAGSAR